jgi:hypothetical protein
VKPIIRPLPFIFILCLAAASHGRVNGLVKVVTQKESPEKTAQDKPGASVNERDSLGTSSPSPYLIEWYIDVNENIDLKQIWKLLKIGIPDDVSYRCRGNCSAETFDISTIDEEQGEAVALKISLEDSDFYQYLIFRMTKTALSRGEWKLIGVIDSRGKRDAPPTHRIESADNRSWFVIRELWAKGPGTLAYGDVWYRVGKGSVKQVLSYPVEGHNATCQKQPGHSYKSVLLRYGMDNGTYTVPLQFLIAYEIPGCGGASAARGLFAKGQRAYFVWDAERERFFLDKSRSDVAEKEISNVYQAAGPTPEIFIEYNFNELLEMAKAGDAEQKDWLRKTLRDVPSSPRKSILLKSIQQ